jgi:hemerythrin superfamily protein
MELVTYLKNDHDEIRSIINELETIDDISRQKKIFAQLLVFMRAHFRAEEISVYSKSLRITNMEMNELALNGYEEHHLLEDFIYKIKTTRDPQLWQDQVRSFCQILRLHLTVEEADYFPELKNHFSDIDLDKAAVLYLKTKKSEENEAQQNQSFIFETRDQLN